MSWNANDRPDVRGALTIATYAVMCRWPRKINSQQYVTSPSFRLARVNGSYQAGIWWSDGRLWVFFGHENTIAT
jgi:hypothetical protein